MLHPPGGFCFLVKNLKRCFGIFKSSHIFRVTGSVFLKSVDKRKPDRQNIRLIPGPALRNPPQRPLPHPRLHLWSWPACMGRHLPALLGPRLLSAHFHPESLGPLRSGKPLRQSLGSHWVCIQGHPGESHSCRGAHSKAAKWNEARKVWSGRKLGGRGGAGLDPHRWLHPAGHQAAP